MTLTLRAVSLNDHPLTQPITAIFDAEGGSVGRGDHNTLALPDPERHISRRHAEISVRNGAYTIRNVGSSNPIFVRGKSLARGESALLIHNDQVRLGAYLLQVVYDQPDDDVETVISGRAAVDAAPPGVQHRAGSPNGAGVAARASASNTPAGTGDLSTPLSPNNPFADLLGDVAPATPATPCSPATGPSRVMLPDDFDPFAPLDPPRAPSAPPAVQVAPAGGGTFDDLIPSTAPPSIDQFFGLRPGERDPLADFMADVVVPRDRETGRGVVLATDPMSMFSDFVPARAESSAPTADDVPELRAAFTPPPRATTPPAAGLCTTGETPRVAPFSSTCAPATDRDALQVAARELWAALCEGAGVSIEPVQGITPELMRAVGSLLHASVAGTLQLMAVRANAKHELRAEVTVIQAGNNNPLKFSPDARSALEQILQPPMRGFLAGPAAMTDAMHDLVGHAIGTMAGTRAALEGVLDRFTPQRLEAKLSVNSVLDSVLPMNRKAKLWALYLQHFDAIRNEAQDDFHSLFGRAFLAAYEQQLERLQRDEPGKS